MVNWRDVLGGDESADHAIGLAREDGIDVHDVPALAEWMRSQAVEMFGREAAEGDYGEAARDLLREYERNLEAGEGEGYLIVSPGLVRQFAVALMPYQEGMALKLIRFLNARSAVSMVKSMDILWRTGGPGAGVALAERFSQRELLYLANLSKADPQTLRWRP